MSALRTADYRTAVEHLGYVVVEGDGAEPNDLFYVTIAPNLFTRVAVYECYTDGPFRFGTVGGTDYLSWPEFLDAMKAVKK